MRRVFISFIVFLCYCTSFSQDNLKEVTIFHWNDFHAYNLPVKRAKKDSSTGETVYYYYGGTSNMLGYLNKYRTPNSLVLNAGDDFQGTPISNFTKGKSQIELLNLYNLDAFVIGNHEFDYGQYALDSALMLAKFDYLSANVYFNPRNSTMGKSYIIRDVNGVKAGIIGITLPELFEVSLPQNVDQVIMLNTDSVIQENITRLKNEDCDIIVLLTHAGVQSDSLFASKFYKDVDVIVGGHSHTPLFKPKIVNGVIIVQAGAVSRWLGKLDLKIDIEKDTVIGNYGKLIETVMDSSMYDRAAQEKVERMVASIGGELGRVIGQLETDWIASYSKESNLGQYEADVFMKKTGTDIAFINGGGLRKSLYSGSITVGDIWEINPFGNEIISFSVTGKTLEQMIRNNILIRAGKVKEGESAEILDVSGLSYSFDSRKAVEDSISFPLLLQVNGQAIEDNRTYTISTNSFVTSQFKKFFGEVSEQIEFQTTGLIDRDVIIESVEKEKIINSVLVPRINDLSEQKEQ
jgi:2',3'-cyclic-nucleotide 2'-phosphodiesterase (5'-nucleotidase family)